MTAHRFLKLTGMQMDYGADTEILYHEKPTYIRADTIQCIETSTDIGAWVNKTHVRESPEAILAALGADVAEVPDAE